MKYALYFFLIFGLIRCAEEATETTENTIPTETGKISWQSFNKAAFDQAQKSEKLVFLEVGANWCHWCHVMDDSTYSDAAVQHYLNANFILCREDQDARPDLFSAYRRWGWPAIIIFNAAGEELLKLKGYQYRKRFLADLKTVRQNPIPLEKNELGENGNSQIGDADEKGLLAEFTKNVDHELGGYNWNNKSMMSSGIKLALQYYDSDTTLKNWVDRTIANSYQLIDPVWSGVYQYSAKKSWDNQHFEKLLRIQADYIEAYCMYGAKTQTQEPLEQAEKIIRYCDRFLNNETPLYYNSQNADLISGVHSAEYYKLEETARLEKGTPSVDPKIYLKENAAMTIALAKLWAATGNINYVEKGAEMLDYILINYGSETGLFFRDLQNETIHSFEDNRKLIDALLIYYQITQKENYLSTATELGYATIKYFDSNLGIRSAFGDLALPAALVSMDNIAAVSTYNMLGHMTALDTFKNYAIQTYSRQNSSQMRRSQTTLPLFIQATKELKNEPFHAQFISDYSNSRQHHSLLSAILINPNSYFVFDVLVRGKMNAIDEDFYGSFDAGTLFMCTSSFCSSPIYSKKDLKAFLSLN